MSQASGQSAEVDATLTSGDSMIEKIAGTGRLGPGRPFANRYTLIARVGFGATGVVHAAHDPACDRKVAIKLLHPNSGAAVARAAQRVAVIAHPNLLGALDVGTVHDVVFVVTDYVEGGTLREWIDAGPHPWPLTIQVFRKIAAGLAAAHRAELVHGKLNPHQVLLDAELEPRIADFGFADEHADTLTDQLAFCEAFFEALYGERPLASRIREPPTRSKVPAWLHRIVVRGLDRDPAKRWPSMDALLDALERTPTRRRLLTAGVLLAVVATLAGIITLALNHR